MSSKMARTIFFLLPFVTSTSWAESDFTALSTEQPGSILASILASEICDQDLIPAMKAIPQAMNAYNADLHKKDAPIDSLSLSEERKAKVREVFELAKKLHLNYLNKAAARHPSPRWTSVIDTVAKTRLRVALRPSATAPMEFGARVLEYGGDQPAEVFVPGISLVVDTDPDVLLFLLLHEIAHTIDPRIYPVPLTGASDSVFTDPVRCLRGADSVRARTGDPVCFAVAAAKKDKQPFKQAALFCRGMSEGLKSNPDHSNSGYGCGCDMPQGSEAFADWLAAEVIASMAPSQITLANTLGWICATYVAEEKRDEEIARMPGGEKMLASQRQLATHPSLSDRIERILLSQPKILLALFPGKTPAALYCPLREPL